MTASTADHLTATARRLPGGLALVLAAGGSDVHFQLDASTLRAQWYDERDHQVSVTRLSHPLVGLVDVDLRRLDGIVEPAVLPAGTEAAVSWQVGAPSGAVAVSIAVLVVLLDGERVERELTTPRLAL